MSGLGQPTLRIADLEFDSRNRPHLADKAIDDNLVWEILLGEPQFAQNPPRQGRSGSHLMIGPSATGRMWTIVMLNVDDTRDIWRPITGWPSTSKEIRLWQGDA